MPSDLDVRGYVDLRLSDVTATELVTRAVLDARSKLPDWQPREGNTELVLIEAVALEVAELVYAVNRAPGAAVEGLLALAGLTRDPGAAPTAAARLTITTPLGTTLPAGVRLRLTGPAGTLPLDLTTDSEVTVPAGELTATVLLTGADRTGEHNGTPAGTRLELVDAVPYLETAVLTAPITGGLSPEDGPALLARGVGRLARLSDALVRPEHFTARALEDPRVTRATTLDRYNPDRPDVPPGGAPGYVTVAVTGPAGQPLTPDARGELAASIAGDALASLVVRVVDATVTPVDVTARVVAAVTVTDLEEVRAACEAALRGLLDPDEWSGSTVYRNELIAELDRVPGVARVDDLTVPAGDLELPGVAPLARPGALAVTVTR